MDPELIPIIVGVGQVNDRPTDPLAGRDPVALMATALREAEHDCSVTLLTEADFLGVVQQMSFPQLDQVPNSVAHAVGAKPKTTMQSEWPSGDSPIMLLNEAANLIGANKIKIALICGAEALHTAAARAAAATPGKRLDVTREAAARREPSYAQRYGLVAPADVYPLYENALRAKLGQSLAEAQRETGEMWSLFSEVANSNPHAWIHSVKSIDEIVIPSPENRPVAFPYSKFMVANSSVNQGAAFIVTSVGEAKRRGIDKSRWIYVGNGAAAHEANSPLQRDRYDQSSSMKVSIQRALELNGIEAKELDRVELYSCFPCIPKLARRVIDWPTDRPATVFGGLTFGGGPIGNYMSHAVASMVNVLRREGGNGLIFANGGYATHNHSIVLSSASIPSAIFPRSYDFQDEVEENRGPIPGLDRDYVGEAIIETFTILYRREASPRAGIVVALTPDGSRTLATVPADDGITLAEMTDSAREPVGRRGKIQAPDDSGLRTWTFIS